MPPDSSAIDAALVATLAADAQLTALCPDGIYWDVAPAGMQRFVLVSLTAADDEPVFEGRAWEDMIYLVKAVMLSTVANQTSKEAAARIDQVLEGATLAANGYDTMIVRRERRFRTTEADPRDPTIQWFHRGGWYRAVMST
jgi:hypothetical protein